MCVTKPPAAPGSGKKPHDPTKKTKTPCKKCWVEDYEKEISVNSYGRYSEVYRKDGIPHNYYGPKQYKIFVYLKARNVVRVKVRFKMNPLAGVTAADVKAAKIKMTKGVKDHWNGKFNLEVDDPECGKKTLPIRYQVAWVTSEQHYTVNINTTIATEGVRGNVMKVAIATDEWTYAHEFAHCVGLPDEYSYVPGDTEAVKYYKPDGTLGTSITAPPGGKSMTAPDATIMSSAYITTVLKRHAWNIAIEVQELLRSKLGRGIKCTIK